MAQIESGDGSGELLTITPNGAALVQQVDTAGNAVNPIPTGSYMLPFGYRHSAATTAGQTIFAMRNTSGGSVVARIRRILAILAFDGTAAAATTLRYSFMRFNTATPSGGTAVHANIVKKRNSYGTSVIGDARYRVDNASGLTVTSVVFESPFATLMLPISVTSGNLVVPLQFVIPGQNHSLLELAPGEGMAIQVDTTNAVIGLSLGGNVEWDEAA